MTGTGRHHPCDGRLALAVGPSTTRFAVPMPSSREPLHRVGTRPGSWNRDKGSVAQKVRADPITCAAFGRRFSEQKRRIRPIYRSPGRKNLFPAVKGAGQGMDDPPSHPRLRPAGWVSAAWIIGAMPGSGGVQPFKTGVSRLSGHAIAPHRRDAVRDPGFILCAGPVQSCSRKIVWHDGFPSLPPLVRVLHQR